MVIGIDIDDVLCDSAPLILDFYNKEYNDNIDWKNIGEYPYLGFLGETKKEAARKLLHFNKSGGPTTHIPYPEAIKALKQLAKKHTLYAITSRPYYIKDETRDWIDKFFPNLFKEIIFNNTQTSEDFLPHTGEPKHSILKRIGASFFVEDLLRYALDCPADIKVFLIDKPWNKGKTPKNVIRVKNWTEIVKSID